MLSHNGVPLRDRLDGVQLHDTLDVLPRLRGGGGDGGSTGAESRSCYLEMYLGKKPDQGGVGLLTGGVTNGEPDEEGMCSFIKHSLLIDPGESRGGKTGALDHLPPLR